MGIRRPIFLVGVLLLASGCGTGGAGGGGVNANFIDRAEIDEYGPASTFDLVQALRPLWLQKRGATSFYDEGDIQVYLDGTGIGGTEALRGIHTDNVENLRFLDERQASYRYGPGHEHGVILVTSRSMVGESGV